MGKKASGSSTKTYSVGYKRPPESTRWKPGKSGNAKGRPKGSKNTATIFSDALNQKIEIQDNGVRRKITIREGIVIQFIKMALKGDMKAIALLLAKEPEIVRQATPVPLITPDMTPAEAAALWQKTFEEGR